MKKIIAIILSLSICLALCACGSGLKPDTANQVTKASEPTSTPAPTEAHADVPVEAPVADDEPGLYSDTPVRVMSLNGTTGFGMAYLMHQTEIGKAQLNYSFSVETDASAVTAALISGDCDIAALPTNAAAALYNKTEGAVQVAALNTLGVLYLVINDDNVTVNTLSDLDGMTVYAPAQNPTFILQALADAAALDIDIDNTYAQPADLRTALAAGEVDVAVLPEPMVTMAIAANESLVAALDLTMEWDMLYPSGSLVQGCVVARRDFAQQHPGELSVFLSEYANSVIYLIISPDESAQYIVDAGIFGNADVAAEAIPYCNVCYIDGQQMQEALGRYLEILFSIAPASVGRAVPEGDFYYIP